MPGGDRTGPMGMGPMTGRAAGLCAGNSVPGFMSPGPGRGIWGRGRGGGWGRRNWFSATGLTGGRRFAAGYPAYGSGPYDPALAPEMSKAQELTMLKNQAEHLKNSLDELGQRIRDLEGQSQER